MRTQVTECGAFILRDADQEKFDWIFKYSVFWSEPPYIHHCRCLPHRAMGYGSSSKGGGGSMTAGSSSKKMKGNKPKAMKPRKVKAKGTDTDGTSADVRSYPHFYRVDCVCECLAPAHHACGLYCGDSGGASGTALRRRRPSGCDYTPCRGTASCSFLLPLLTFVIHAETLYRSRKEMVMVPQVAVAAVRRQLHTRGLTRP